MKPLAWSGELASLVGPEDQSGVSSSVDSGGACLSRNLPVLSKLEKSSTEALRDVPLLSV